MRKHKIELDFDLDVNKQVINQITTFFNDFYCVVDKELAGSLQQLHVLNHVGSDSNILSILGIDDAFTSPLTSYLSAASHQQ